MRVETGPVSEIIFLLTKTRNQLILHVIYCCTQKNCCFCSAAGVDECHFLTFGTADSNGLQRHVIDPV
jgi:hypothetical protein